MSQYDMCYVCSEKFGDYGIYGLWQDIEDHGGIIDLCYDCYTTNEDYYQRLFDGDHSKTINISGRDFTTHFMMRRSEF